MCNEINFVVLNKSTLYFQNTVSDSIIIVLDGSISYYFEPDPQIQISKTHKL